MATLVVSRLERDRLKDRAALAGLHSFCEIHRKARRRFTTPIEICVRIPLLHNLPHLGALSIGDAAAKIYSRHFSGLELDIFFYQAATASAERRQYHRSNSSQCPGSTRKTPPGGFRGQSPSRPSKARVALWH